MKVRELLSDESKWTQFKLARNASGIPVDPKSPKASSFCLSEAIWRCYPDYDLRKNILHKIITKIDCSVVGWNDTHTFAEVKALVDELDI